MNSELRGMAGRVNQVIGWAAYSINPDWKPFLFPPFLKAFVYLTNAIGGGILNNIAESKNITSDYLSGFASLVFGLRGCGGVHSIFRRTSSGFGAATSRLRGFFAFSVIRQPSENQEITSNKETLIKWVGALTLFLVFVIRVIDGVKPTFAGPLLSDLIFTAKGSAPSYVDGVCIFDPSHHIDTPACIAEANILTLRPHRVFALKNARGRFSRLERYSSKASWSWVFPLIWSFHWQAMLPPMHKTITTSDICFRTANINNIELTTNKMSLCEYSWLLGMNRTRLPNYNITDMKFRSMSQNNSRLHVIRLFSGDFKHTRS
jgi:hypothetical protein